MDIRYTPGWRPKANPAAVLTGANYRITVLTPALIRLEWADSGLFEDRASTFAVNRDLPVPPFAVRDDRGRLELVTDRLHLFYDRGRFSAAGLSVEALGGVTNYHSVWRFGDDAAGEGGTARTLDGVDGAVPLGPGVVSQTGIAVIDDSRSFLFGDDGLAATRIDGSMDLYVFAAGRDYAAAVRDLYRVSGAQPILPRWALGNWWSRYHPYSARDYQALMDEFADRGLPFSVSVLDMDWHRTDVDPRHGSGWTGYSWNRDLFPDPVSFLRNLHERGLRVTLNVHPADGIRPFEDAYDRVAEALGATRDDTILFDPTDRAFLDAYFDLVHHPLEDEGVDFWWLDWQQGTSSRIPDVDPLWLLNHFHFLDSARGGRRPLTFSRFAGPGSHRYPIGFSGDAVISWASLDFQPYFTATASNIGYGWWSHDIGGHLFGLKDDALAARWVQFGVFSPISRLHSSAHPFIRKEPWVFGVEAERSMTSALRFRHRLVPYLHTMNARGAFLGEPMVQPLYWRWPEAPEAYDFANQYLFGTELMVAPITTPQDDTLGLGSVAAWLPEGAWSDLYTGRRYVGGRQVRLHRTLQDIPVLLRAGGVLPLAIGTANDTANPEALEVVVAMGADGRFELLEDSEGGDGRDPARWATTVLEYDDARRLITINAASGAVDMLPPTRSWTVTVLGAADGTRAEVDGIDLEPLVTDAGISFQLAPASVRYLVSLRLASLIPRGWTHLVDGIFQLLDRAQLPFESKRAAFDAVRESYTAADAAARITGLELAPQLERALLELVLAQPDLIRDEDDRNGPSRDRARLG